MEELEHDGGSPVPAETSAFDRTTPLAGLDTTIRPGNSGHGPLCNHLGAEISTENGQGEDTLASFIQAHLQSILKPFAMHVEEIHRSLGHLSTEMGHIAAKTEKNEATLDEHTGALGGLRADLGQANRKGGQTQQALEKLTEETVNLSTDFKQTKAEFADASARLQEAWALLPELQSGLRGTRSSVGKLREGLGKLERDLAARIGPTMDKLVLDLKHLDSLHQATAKSLSETRNFAEVSLQAFQVFEKENEQRHGGIDRRFEHADVQFSELGRSLKDMRNFDHLQEEHLNALDSVLVPVKQRLDQLEGARDDAKRRHNDMEKLVTDLQVHSNSMAIDVDKLVEFREDMRRGEDIFEVVQKLKREVGLHSDSIHGLVETTGGHASELRKGDQRAAALEKSTAALQQQTFKMSEQIGMSTPATSRSPSRGDCARPRSQVGHYDYKEGISVKDGIPIKEKMPLAVMRALDKMSIAARQKRAIDQINEHSRELANTTTTLSKTACHLDNTESRVANIEAQLESVLDQLRRVTLGMDLNQEYWKGLGKGLKETSRSINTEGEVLPLRGSHGMKLPLISRPSSRQHGNLTAR